MNLKTLITNSCLMNKWLQTWLKTRNYKIIALPKQWLCYCLSTRNYKIHAISQWKTIQKLNHKKTTQKLNHKKTTQNFNATYHIQSINSCHYMLYKLHLLSLNFLIFHVQNMPPTTFNWSIPAIIYCTNSIYCLWIF